jgi:hypothetical protein
MDNVHQRGRRVSKWLSKNVSCGRSRQVLVIVGHMVNIDCTDFESANNHNYVIIAQAWGERGMYLPVLLIC